MKVVAFSGSARRGGNTATLVKRVFRELEKAGIEHELVELAGKVIRGCTGCGLCGQRKNRRCSMENDVINECIAKMIEADGILLASPTYFTDVSSEMKALIDRAGMVGKSNDYLFRRKVGAAVVAVRRAGSTHAFDTMNHFFFIEQKIVPGSSYWNVGIGGALGAVEKDEEGLETMRVLGENMAWVLVNLHE